MKKPLDIRIFEYLEALPAERFPLKELELPREAVAAEELIAEVFRLEAAGLVKAATARDSQGQPALAVIIERTHHGRLYLSEWLTEERKRHPIRRSLKWVGSTVLAGIVIILTALLTKCTDSLFEFLKRPLHLQ